jgi:hypothetical protein
MLFAKNIPKPYFTFSNVRGLDESQDCRSRFTTFEYITPVVEPSDFEQKSRKNTKGVKFIVFQRFVLFFAQKRN